uniref:Secreted protein n=1 Tax=Bursaphelenchus xylophilus TaxID=6326 RepID=A0A1I7S5G0_BURXY
MLLAFLCQLLFNTPFTVTLKPFFHLFRCAPPTEIVLGAVAEGRVDNITITSLLLELLSGSRFEPNSSFPSPLESQRARERVLLEMTMDS